MIERFQNWYVNSSIIYTTIYIPDYKASLNSCQGVVVNNLKILGGNFVKTIKLWLLEGQKSLLQVKVN